MSNFDINKRMKEHICEMQSLFAQFSYNYNDKRKFNILSIMSKYIADISLELEESNLNWIQNE